MKILHITDSHGTVKGPESRKDVYYLTFLKKMYELGYVVKRYEIDMVVHTGDLFHTARVSDKFAGQVSQMIRAMGVPFYVVPGNHDIEGYTTDTIDQTKLGLLAKTGVITILDRDNPILIKRKENGEEYTVAISGQEYYAHIDEGNAKDFEMQQDEADLNILAIHGYLTDTPQHPDIKCTMVKDVITDADIILTGHYHRMFEWFGTDVSIFNPGSMMRVEQTDYNKTHMPHYGILDISLVNGQIVYDYVFQEFKIAEDSTVIFDYDSKYKAKHTSITLEGFKNSLANTMGQVNVSSNNMQTIIQNICSGASVDAEIEKKAIDIYNLTLQSIPDEFEAPTGFIESNKRKKISHVILKNFQSHEDTTLYFDKGLNIIVGESNNGKTAILRGIMWVIDNQPLGADFIMAGKDECSVSVYFDDGTSITRGRTRKDTGYYDIYYHDDNGNVQHGQYRGFTNAVPIEVANVHQMPKVNITKDIETHLNVLSQLEPPFLLTESPMTKASAIGRITGTHVLDAGIKQSNKTIQSNKKAVKIHETTLAEKNNELNNLPDLVLVEKVFKAHQAIVSYVSKKHDNILKINQKYEDISSCKKKIFNVLIELTDKEAIAKLLPLVTHAQQKLEKCQKINKMLEDYDQTKKYIYLTQQDIERCNMLKKIQVIQKQAGIHVFNVYHLTEQIDKIETISERIVTTNIMTGLTKDFIRHTESIVAYCKILHAFISKVKPKLDMVDSLSIQQEVLKTEISSHKKFVKTLKTSITKTTKEQNKYVLDNGICPCCGQPVTEAMHSESIINFFSNNKED